MSGNNNRLARFDVATPAVIIEDLTVLDPCVISEARRWITGTRGPVVKDVDELAAADLTGFVTQALAVGAQAISVAGGVQESVNLEGLVVEAEKRTAEASAQAAVTTSKAVRQAGEAITAAADAAKQSLAELGTASRTDFKANVEQAGQHLRAELQRLLGGENPELLTRLDPVLQRFGRDLDDRTRKQSEELIGKVSKQFDTTDPSSPMAQQARTLAQQHSHLEQVVTDRHTELGTQVIELSKAVGALAAARTAAAAVRLKTTLKGVDYEDAVGVVMQDIAAGLGDDYCVTRNTTGSISRSKKGDGVLHLSGHDAAILVEAKNTTVRIDWRGYLDEAERNRDASGSIGLARSADALDGQTFLILGPRRLVMVFDPDVDSPDLLRTIVQVMRMAVIASIGKRNDGVVVADEKIADAFAALSRFSAVRKLATEIQRKAGEIDISTAKLEMDLTRLLTEAQQALTDVNLDESAGHAA